jgi:hypothetical protein
MIPGPLHIGSIAVGGRVVDGEKRERPGIVSNVVHDDGKQSGSEGLGLAANGINEVIIGAKEPSNTRGPPPA